MAEKKPRKNVRPSSPDRMEMMRKGKAQAGKPKAKGNKPAAVITRQMQNKGVKDGTIRIGKAGRTYNVYDERSGTWKRGIVKKAETPKKAPSRSGNSKEAGLVKRPTHQNPSYGAEHIVGGTKNQPRYGNVIVNPSRRQSKAPRITRVPKKDR